MTTQEGLFAAPVSAHPGRRTVPATKTPKWGTYAQKSAKRPHLCDFCVLNNHDMRMSGEEFRNIPLPRKARYRRTTIDTDWYLCAAHANDQRILDGLAKFKK